MKRALLMIGLVVLTGIGAVALAAGQSGPPQSSPGGMGGMMGGSPAERPWISLALQHRDELGLTPEQATRLEALRSEFQKDATRRFQEIEAAETELAGLLRADPVDLSKVETTLRQLEAGRTDLRLSRLKTIEAGKALLTPEQRKKLASLVPGAAAVVPEMNGIDERHGFMHSGRGARAMTGMMGMARRMGNAHASTGMVRMIEMVEPMTDHMGSDQMSGTMDGHHGPSDMPGGLETPTQRKPAP